MAARMRRGFALAGLLVCWLCRPYRSASGAENKPFIIETTAAYALGGHHAAYHDGIFSLFSNPAALGSVQYNGILRGGLGASANLDEGLALFNALVNGAKIADSMVEGYAKKSLGWTPPEIYLNGPFAAGYAEKERGYALFDRVWFDSSLFNNTWYANLNADIIIAGGRSFNFVDTYNHKFDIGGTLRLGARYSKNMIFAAVQTGSKGGGVSRSDRIIIAPQASAGILYSFRDTFSAGIQCDDILTPDIFFYLDKKEDDDPLYRIDHQKLNFGLSLRMAQNGALAWNIMADFRDALHAAGVFEGEGEQRNAALYLSAGMELQIRGVFTLRAGIRDLLPAAGIGYNFGRFVLDAAFYGKEYGLSPGEYSVYMADIGFTVR